MEAEWWLSEPVGRGQGGLVIRWVSAWEGEQVLEMDGCAVTGLYLMPPSCTHKSVRNDKFRVM